MRQYHKQFVPEYQIPSEAVVQIFAILTDDVTERDCNIAERDHDVAANIWIFGWIQELEQRPMVLIAEELACGTAHPDAPRARRQWL